MSKDTTFKRGTIVQADYLNDDQEVDTGLAWGVRLAQSGSATVETGIVGDPNDSQGPLIIGGRRVWKNGASNPATASGAAGDREVFVSTTDALVPNYDVEVLPTGSLPASAYWRRLGTATWDGVAALTNIKLAHGVQAEAEQYNQFTLRTISNAAADIALTVEGYTSQNSVASKLVSVGYDDGAAYRERFTVRGDGRVVLQSGAANYIVLSTHVEADLVSRMHVTSDGGVRWGTGALAHDTYLDRTASGTLKIHDGTVGGDGVLDMVYLQNTDSGGALYNGAGMVNVLDDLNLALGQVYRIDGEQFDADMLADGADVAHLSRTQTFTGEKTFTNVTHFQNVVELETANGYLSREAVAASNIALTSRVVGDANPRFELLADGTAGWGDGTAAMDVFVSRIAPNILTIATGDRFEQAYNAAVSEPTILVNRGTLDATLASETASKAFALFIS